mgnify:CR=1 FL=1
MAYWEGRGDRRIFGMLGLQHLGNEHLEFLRADRFAQGMTFDEYVAYIGTPEDGEAGDFKDGDLFRDMNLIGGQTDAVEGMKIWQGILALAAT